MRILLVGEHALLLQGLTKLLEDELAAEVRTVRRPAEIEDALDRWKPVVALFETTRVESAQALTSLFAKLDQDVPVLVIAPSERDEFLAALRAGAKGFVGRHVNVEELLGALQAVRRGEWGIPRSLVGYLVEDYLRLVRANEAVSAAGLTERERQVLVLLARGMNARQVGETLYVSPSTVRGVIRGTIQKLGVENRTQAVAEALRRGLLDPTSLQTVEQRLNPEP